jgi:hypothetical protein
MVAIESSEPGEKPGACWRDTLKTSVCALPLLPAAEGLANRHPAPHLTLSPRTVAQSHPADVLSRSRRASSGFLIEGSPQGRIRKGVGEWRVCRGGKLTKPIAAMGRSNKATYITWAVSSARRLCCIFRLISSSR